MTIGEVARQAGVRASTIRFYEQGGLLPGAIRSNGRRVYGESILELLEVIEFAKQSGFRLDEIRRLFQSSPNNETVSLRWRALVRAKLDELKVQQERIAAMRILLERAEKCRCLDVAECGRVLLKAKKAKGTE